MAIFASTTTSGYSDPLKAMSIKALEQRYKDMQAQQATQQAGMFTPENTQTPIQGFAQVANTAVDAMRSRRADEAVAAQKMELAKVMAGMNIDQPTAQEVAKVNMYDPELARQMLTTLAENRRTFRGQDVTVRGQDVGANTAYRGQDVTVRGQDVGAGTTIRGQDVGADTARRGQDVQVRGQDVQVRGQDVGADTARRGQDITVRGQDVGADTARRGQDITVRGQDVGADTARRGQDIVSADTQRGQDVTVRGQDVGADTARRGQDITVRGQDVGAGTAIRGQDVGADTARRGQDITVRGQDVGQDTAIRGQDVGADTARRGQDVQVRGQDVTARGQDVQAATAEAEAKAKADALAKDPKRAEAVRAAETDYRKGLTHIDNLEEASRILDHPKGIYTGAAQYAAPIAGGLPGGSMLVDKEKAQRTARYNTIVGEDAIRDMATTLKGSSTNFEMNEFKKMKNDPNISDADRAAQLRKVVKAARADLEAQAKEVQAIGGDIGRVDRAMKGGDVDPLEGRTANGPDGPIIRRNGKWEKQ